METEPKHGNGAFGEKFHSDESPNGISGDTESLSAGQNKLHQELKGRHMQMIAM
jgi:amino acid permease